MHSFFIHTQGNNPSVTVKSTLDERNVSCFAELKTLGTNNSLKKFRVMLPRVLHILCTARLFSYFLSSSDARLYVGAFIPFYKSQIY